MFLGLTIYLKFGTTQRRYAFGPPSHAISISNIISKASNICSRTDCVHPIVPVGITILSLHIPSSRAAHHQDSSHTPVHAPAQLISWRFTFRVDPDHAEAIQHIICVRRWTRAKCCFGWFWLGNKGSVDLTPVVCLLIWI